MVKSPIFIVGNGRSGTHWLARTLKSHPNIRATIEYKPIFSIVTKMALDPPSQNRLYWKLVLRYMWEILKSYPNHYLDKSHPNIWLAERLKRTFSGALFVGIERDPYATIASMILHDGVNTLHKRWREFPIPNKFLGIDKENKDIYDNLPIAKNFALSWLSHHDRMNELRSVLGTSLKVINYEHFAKEPQKIIEDLRKFLGLPTPLEIPKVKQESLNKWENQLSSEQIRQITKIVGFIPGEFEKEFS